MINRELINKYAERTTDKRMVNIINKNFSNEESILDLGCGSGLYGKFLKSKCKKLIGFDYEPVLCSMAKNSGFYDEVICDNVNNINKEIHSMECVFCSELLEHINNKDFPSVISKIEDITTKKICITVPNPLSPHFKYDSSHILKYSVYSFLEQLNKSNKFSYKLYAIGFSELNLKKWYFRILNVFSSVFPIFSPTVLYIGEPKKMLRA